MNFDIPSDNNDNNCYRKDKQWTGRVVNKFQYGWSNDGNDDYSIIPIISFMIYDPLKIFKEIENTLQIQYFKYFSNI